jgi:hypothetical protein
MVRIDQLHDDSVELPIWPTSTSRCLSTSTISGSWNDKYMFQLGSARHFADYFFGSGSDQVCNLWLDALAVR